MYVVIDVVVVEYFCNSPATPQSSLKGLVLLLDFQTILWLDFEMMTQYKDSILLLGDIGIFR